MLPCVGSEVECLDGQNPRSREEVELLRQHFLQSAQVPSQIMFFCDTLNAWVHVYLLIEPELRKELRLYCRVVPSQVIGWVELQPSLATLVRRTDIVFLRADQAPFQAPVRCFLHDFVPSARNVDHDLPI